MTARLVSHTVCDYCGHEGDAFRNGRPNRIINGPGGKDYHEFCLKDKQELDEKAKFYALQAQSVKGVSAVYKEEILYSSPHFQREGKLFVSEQEWGDYNFLRMHPTAPREEWPSEVYKRQVEARLTREAIEREKADILEELAKERLIKKQALKENVEKPYTEGQ